MARDTEASACTVLVESDGFAREANRALRRDLCVSRVVILVLLVTQTALCVLLFIQPAREDKNKETVQEPMAMPSWYEVKNDIDSGDANSPLLALMAVAPDGSSNTLKLSPTHRHLANFTLDHSNLIIPYDGKYKIGLQITYDASNADKRHHSLDQQVVKTSPAYDITDHVILSSFDTLSCGREPVCLKSVFSETFAVLQAGDRIRALSGNPELISYAGIPGTKTFLTIQFLYKV